MSSGVWSTHLVVVPILLPMASAVLALMMPRAARVVSLLGAIGTLAAAAALVLQAADGAQSVYLLGNWPAPFGVALLSDRLGAWTLLATAWVLLGVLVFSTGGARDGGAFFHPLFHILWMGVNGAFLTADVFNLFVFFEVMLVGSYGLALNGAGQRGARATLDYVAINLAGSALFLIAAGVLYGVCGSLSFADLAVRLPMLGAADRPLALAGVGLLAVVFLLKAAALPLSAWLPRTYGAIAPVSAAAFTLLSKLGAYCLLRIVSLWGAALGDDILITVMLGCGAGTLLLAGFGALASLTLTRTAAWAVLASSGFLIVTMAGGSVQTLAAGLFYLPAGALSASALFLVADLHRRDALGDARIWLFLAAAGVAGLPPMASFLAKLQALDGLLSTPSREWTVAVMLFASLLMLIGVARVGLRMHREGAGRAGVAAHLALAWLCAGALALGVLAAPAQRYTQATARGLMSADSYVGAVLGARPMEPVR